MGNTLINKTLYLLVFCCSVKKETLQDMLFWGNNRFGCGERSAARSRRHVVDYLSCNSVTRSVFFLTNHYPHKINIPSLSALLQINNFYMFFCLFLFYLITFIIFLFVNNVWTVSIQGPERFCEGFFSDVVYRLIYHAVCTLMNRQCLCADGRKIRA